MFRELGFYMMPGFFCRNEMFRELGFYMMPGFFFVGMRCSESWAFT